MLGDLLCEEQGQTTGMRVLPTEGVCIPQFLEV